jgi:hypothetical protein
MSVLCGLGRGVGSMWVKGSIGLSFTTKDQSLILALVIKFIARVIALGFGGHRECPWHASRPPIFDSSRRGGGQRSGCGGCGGGLMADSGRGVATVARGALDELKPNLL